MDQKGRLILSMAPIQGVTDFRFRNCFHKHFGGIDRYYAPYIRLRKGMEIPGKNIRDITGQSDKSDLVLIPQIMSVKSDEIKFLADYLSGLGYQEMNWNLGCPYPMVTGRKLGAGILPYPDELDKILTEIMPSLSIRLSVKIRLGMTDYAEIDSVIPVLNKYDVEEIILHPRIAKDLYKVPANKNGYGRAYLNFNSVPAYNGDIFSLADYSDLMKRYPEIGHVMLGRGLIRNPFLGEEIKQFASVAMRQCANGKEEVRRFWGFHDELFEEVSGAMHGSSHILTKMRGYWEYWCEYFENPKRVFKGIKKSRSITDYETIISGLRGQR